MISTMTVTPWVDIVRLAYDFSEISPKHGLLPSDSEIAALQMLAKMGRIEHFTGGAFDLVID